jgi:predicted peptidase
MKQATSCLQTLRSSLSLLTVGLGLFVPMKTAIAQVETQAVKSFEKAITRTVRAQYLLFLPQGYEAQGAKKWPLMLFLHGAGERGTNIWKVAVHGPPKIVRAKADFPFILASPQCPDGEHWSNEVLLHLLDDLTASHAVDTNRIYLTGLSMGGYGTWSLATQYPERFAAVAPVCGGGERISILLSGGRKAQALRSLGVWAFHGGKDTVVPFSESERMVEALKKIGCTDVQLTVYPESGHDSWTETYNNPALYEWFLKHTR